MIPHFQSYYSNSRNPAAGLTHLPEPPFALSVSPRHDREKPAMETTLR